MYMHAHLHDKKIEDDEPALTKELHQGFYERLGGFLSHNHKKKGGGEEGRTPPENQGSSQSEEKRRVSFPMTWLTKQTVKFL